MCLRRGLDLAEIAGLDLASLGQDVRDLLDNDGDGHITRQELLDLDLNGDGQTLSPDPEP